jgi:hypothetical protein
VRENTHTHTKRPQFYTGVEAENSLRSKEKPGRYFFSPFSAKTRRRRRWRKKHGRLLPPRVPLETFPNLEDDW